MHAEEESLAAEVNPRVRGLFLKNLADFQTELARVHAGFVPAVPVWSQRKELPMLIFRSLRRVQDVRLRGRELGVSFADMHVSRSVAGRRILDELCGAATAADFFATAMVVVPRKLITAISDYLERNQNVYDLPSVALLEATRDELKAQAVWAESAAAAHAETTGERADATFVARIESLSSELAESLREQRPRSTEPLRVARRIGNLPRADSVMPAGFRHLEFGPDPIPAENTYAHRERFHAVNFLQEVQAADSCVSILFEAPDMPWDFYFDLSRHMWDESRHAAFGEAKLADLGSSAPEAGLSTKAYAMRQTLTPLDRYTALATQEADAFPGKHVGLKDAVTHGDRVSAMAWSYDIADETQHVRFGNKWIPVMMEKTGEPRSFEQLKNDACNWRRSVLAEVYKPVAASFVRAGAGAA